MRYPYPIKAILLTPPREVYKDGGTEEYRVKNADEVGLKYIYKDFRINSKTKGKYFTKYPTDTSGQEIVSSFIIHEASPTISLAGKLHPHYFHTGTSKSIS